MPLYRNDGQSERRTKPYLWGRYIVHSLYDWSIDGCVFGSILQYGVLELGFGFGKTRIQDGPTKKFK
jgi:hypothetical protein